jgi:hypothetical protein
MDFQKMKFKVEFVELENDEKPFIEFVLHFTINVKG